MTRLIGGALIALGALILADDMMSAMGVGIHLSAAGEVWFHLSPASLNLTQAILERHVWPWLWNPLALTILLWPACAVIAAAGVIVVALGEVRAQRGRRR